MESPATQRRLRRSNSLTELVNPQGVPLSSPVFYMRNSRKKRNQNSNTQQEPEDHKEVPQESTAPREIIQLDDDCLVNLQHLSRRSTKKRLISSPDYPSFRNSTTSSLPDNPQTSLLPSRQNPDGQDSDLMSTTKEWDLRNEEKYMTMSSSKLSSTYVNMPHDDYDHGITAAAVLHEIALWHLTCDLCNKRYKEPKALDCLHTFCTSCLQGWLDKSPGPERSKINCPCPTCPEVTKLSQANELTEVRDNKWVLELLENVNRLEKCLTGQRTDASVDGVQTIQEVATDCQKLSLYDRDLSSDNGDDQPGPTTLPEAAVSDALKTCPKHPGKYLKLFCKTCQVMICKDCTLSDHHAARHRYVDATSAVAVCKSTLNTMLPVIQKDCTESTQAASSARHAYCRLHMMIQTSKNKILQMEEQEVYRVRAQGAQLRKEVTDVGKQRAMDMEEIYARHCDHAKKASLTVVKIKHVLTQASSLEILKMKQDLFENITTVMNNKVISQTHDLSFLDFKGDLPNPPSNIYLGKLLTKEKWKKKIDFGQGPGKGFRQVGYVAVYSNGDVAATDMETWTMTVVKCVHHISYPKKLNEHTKEVLTRPYTIAINTDDDLIVIDNSKVKVLNKQMKVLLQVPTSFPEYPVRNSFGSILSCLAVDKQNRIAVGHRGKEIISLHKQDGTLIQVVPAPMIDTQLTINQQHRLVYSNYEARKVLSTELSGQRVFCVDTNDKLPTGVCCDNAGYIFVAMHTESSGRCEIHQFDPDGVVIACVVRELDNPLGLTFTKDEELVVADKYSVKIYRRV